MLPHGPPAKALTSNFVLLSQEESRTKHFCLVTGKSCTDRLEQEHVCKHNSPFLGVMRVFSWAIADICQVAVCQQDIECLINHSMCASGSHLSEFDRQTGFLLFVSPIVPLAFGSSSCWVRVTRVAD